MSVREDWERDFRELLEREFRGTLDGALCPTDLAHAWSVYARRLGLEHTKERREMVSINHAREYRGAKTLIIDVSHHQGAIDWDEVKRDPQGIAGVIVRFGDGKDVDTRVIENLREATRVGLRVGGYRYLRGEHGSDLQLELDAGILKRAGVVLTLPLCPDLEGHPYHRGRDATGAWQDVRSGVSVSTPDVLRVTHEYLKGATEIGGLASWLYTGRAWLDFVRTPPAWAESTPLWLAVGSGGRVPEPFRDVRMHQYSARGQVQGIRTNVDMNYYFGSATQLRAEGDGTIPFDPTPLGGLLRRLVGRG